MKKFQLATQILLVFLFIFGAQPAQSAEEFDTLFTSLRLLWGLLIVLAVILMLYYFLRKRFSIFQQHGEGLINIVEVKHVMPKKSLMLVEVRGKEFLIGCGNDSITAITPLSSNSSFATLLEKSEDIHR